MTRNFVPSFTNTVSFVPKVSRFFNDDQDLDLFTSGARF